MAIWSWRPAYHAWKEPWAAMRHLVIPFMQIKSESMKGGIVTNKNNQIPPIPDRDLRGLFSNPLCLIIHCAPCRQRWTKNCILVLVSNCFLQIQLLEIGQSIWQKYLVSVSCPIPAAGCIYVCIANSFALVTHCTVTLLANVTHLRDECYHITVNDDDMHLRVKLFKIKFSKWSFSGRPTRDFKYLSLLIALQEHCLTFDVVIVMLTSVHSFLQPLLKEFETVHGSKLFKLQNEIPKITRKKSTYYIFNKFSVIMFSFTCTIWLRDRIYFYLSPFKMLLKG